MGNARRLQATAAVHNPSAAQFLSSELDIAATEHSKELGKYARFQIHVESCSGLDNAFQVGIYVAGNHNAHGVSIQPFECNVHVHEKRKLRSLLSAADKVHDLKPIAVFERCVAPLRARHDLAIEFDGNAVALHAQLFDQLRQRQGIGKALFFAVDQQVHDNTVIESRNRCAAVEGADQPERPELSGKVLANEPLEWIGATDGLRGVFSVILG